LLRLPIGKITLKF